MKKEKKKINRKKITKKSSVSRYNKFKNAYLMLLIFFFICGSIIAISYMSRVYLDISSARNSSKLDGYFAELKNNSLDDYYPIFSLNSK